MTWYSFSVTPSCAVTVTVTVFSPNARARSAVFGVLVSSSPAIATVAPRWFSVAVTVTLAAVFSTSASYSRVPAANAGVRLTCVPPTLTDRAFRSASAAAASSFSMVPVAVFGVPSAAFEEGLASVTVRVSSPSWLLSSPVATEMVPVVCPARTVSCASATGAV